MKKGAFKVLLLCSIFFPLSLRGSIVKKGEDFTEASRAMFAAGYKENGLDMISMKRDERLMFWSLEKGTLIVVYSKETNKIVGVSFYWSDGRKKASRETVNIAVNSFDIESGALVLQMKKPKEPAKSNIE